MSRGRSRSPKRGVFTGSQFSALNHVTRQCHEKLTALRVRGITFSKDACLPLFVKADHRETVMAMGKLRSNGNRSIQLATDTFAKYQNKYVELTVPVTLVVQVTGLPFTPPDYAVHSSGPQIQTPRANLPEALQKYVDIRLALALEFGLLEAILEWFSSKHLLFPEMKYLFPPIIPLCSLHTVTKPLAEKYSKPTMPSAVPTPPGMREAFSVVESTLMKVIMTYDEPVTIPTTIGEVSLSVRFPGGINMMGWNVSL